MGCKCANSNENEEEINKNVEDGNDENSQNDFNKNFNKEENLLGYNNNNQENIYPSDNQNNNIEPPSNPQDIISNEDQKLKYSDYPEKIVDLINNIREDPVSYADLIEDSIQYIVEEEDKNDPLNTRLIFKKKVKVALNRGESAFREAADYLRTLNPLPPLEFTNDKCIPLPETEDELKDPTFLREQVRVMREQTQIDVFFKDLIKVPEVSGLLMIP